ncbi:MAG: glycosyltransferase family 2 protein [bacterium]|nr:glycosyltransferase family 2 protein [bacterium]
MTKRLEDSVAATIPAYQAAPWIGDLVRRTLKVLPEILVVDDGSDDDTAGEARRAGAEVVSLPTNQGKGAALRTAFDLLFARGYSAVVTLDADGQHLPEEIPVLLEAQQNGADLILGTRDHLFREMATIRRTANRLSSRIISLVAGQLVSDAQTGFRLYSRRLIETTRFPESHFDAESAVLVRCGRYGFRIATVPIRLGPVDGRQTSHYRFWVDTLRIAASVTRARLERRR